MENSQEKYFTMTIHSELHKIIKKHCVEKNMTMRQFTTFSLVNALPEHYQEDFSDFCTSQQKDLTIPHSSNCKNDFQNLIEKVKISEE